MVWLEIDDALDFLRIPADNADIIDQLAQSVPAYIEATTGYPAELTAGANPNEVVKSLARFVIQLWYNPDGTDGDQLMRVVESLQKTVRAMVAAGL